MTAGLEALLARWTTLEAATVHLLARLAAIAVTAVVLLLAYRLVVRVIARLSQKVQAVPGANPQPSS